MANAYVLNQLPVGYGAAMSLLVEMLISAGWTYKSSGDGSGNYAPPSVTATVNISNASPAVVTWTTHGLPANAPVVFTTTGALPTGITAGTTYYVMSTGLVTNAFQISATPGGAAINTSSAGSGVHTGTSSPKIFTNTTSGAALSWGNGNAWARVQDPAGAREFVFQHDNTGGARIKYSSSAKFTGGAASTSVSPFASDEQWVCGDFGTGNFFYTTWFGAGVAVGATLFQGAAMSAAPYGFWFAGADYPRGQMRTGIMHDPVISVPEDPDPYVIAIGKTNSFQSSASFYGKDGTSNGNLNNTGGSSSTEGLYAFMNAARTVFLSVFTASYCTGTLASAVMNAGLSVNPFSGKPEAMPIAYMRFETPESGITQNPGLKGWSTFSRWTGSSRATFSDTLNNKSFICVGAVWLPWDGVTTPLS